MSNSSSDTGCLLWIIVILLFAIAAKMGAC